MIWHVWHLKNYEMARLVIQGYDINTDHIISVSEILNRGGYGYVFFIRCINHIDIPIEISQYNYYNPSDLKNYPSLDKIKEYDKIAKLDCERARKLVVENISPRVNEFKLTEV